MTNARANPCPDRAPAVAAGHLQSVPVYIIHFNSPDLLRRSVEAYRASEGVQAIIHVVDDCSTDLPTDFHDYLGLVPGDSWFTTPYNSGFTGAANVAMRHFLRERSERFMILAPHDSLPDRDAVKRLVEVTQETSAGIVGADRGDGAIGLWHPVVGWRIGRLFHGPPAIFGRSYPWLLGHCLLIRRQTLLAIGPEDERIFAYGDDVDLCIRAQRAGISIALAAGATVKNAGIPSSSPDLIAHLTARNSVLLARKHHGRLATLARIAWIAARALKALLYEQSGAASIAGHPMAALNGVRDAMLGRWGNPLSGNDKREHIAGGIRTDGRGILRVCAPHGLALRSSGDRAAPMLERRQSTIGISSAGLQQ